MKGIENLIRAFSTSSLLSDWRLVIAGPEEDQSYTAKIKSLAVDHGDRIEFVGPVYGEKKDRLLQEAWALVAPSFTEVIGMVNLEAGAINTPSLTTAETGLFDWENGGGVIVVNDVSLLRMELERAATWTMDERLERGKSSRSLVEKRYSLDVVGEQWLQLYHQIKLKNESRMEGC